MPVTVVPWHGRSVHRHGHGRNWHAIGMDVAIAMGGTSMVGLWCWPLLARGPWRLGLGLLLTALDPAKPNERSPAGAGWLSGPAPVQLVGEMRVGGMQDK
jgi:hypothetical protein